MSLLIAVVVVSTAGIRLATRRSDASVADQKLAVPSYFWPGAKWASLIASVGIVDTAVVNVDSGPGTAMTASFATMVAQAQAAGLHLFGYVDTAYGSRPVGDVLADIDRYHNWYGIDRVFLDQVPSDCSHSAYFSGLYNTVHARSAGQVILNPGTNPMECEVAVSDVIVNFEGTAASYLSWSPAAWVANYPASHFWHLVYGTPSAVTSDVVMQSRSRNAGFLFVTDDDFPNPWDGLGSSTSWSTLLAVWNTRREAPAASGPASTIVRGAAPSAGPPTTLGPAGAPAASDPPTVAGPDVSSGAVSTGVVSTDVVSTGVVPAPSPASDQAAPTERGSVSAVSPYPGSGPSAGSPTLAAVDNGAVANAAVDSRAIDNAAVVGGPLADVPAAPAAAPANPSTSPSPNGRPIARLLVGVIDQPGTVRPSGLRRVSTPPVARVRARRSVSTTLRTG